MEPARLRHIRQKLTPSGQFALRAARGALRSAPASLAALTCLMFVVGLSDTRLSPIEQRPVTRAVASDANQSGRLYVSVRTPKDKPIAEAIVGVFVERDRRFLLAGTGRTDHTGSSQLEQLALGKSWILVNKKGYARASSQLVISEKPRWVRVKLEREHELKVRVEDEEGQALAQATVLVEARDPLPFGALTDQAGTAQLKRLGPPPWDVRAAARGYESATRSGVTGPLTLTLRKLGSLSVRVIDKGGQPVRGAEIDIAGSGLWPPRQATTDAGGVATISGLSAGSYDLRASEGQRVSPTIVGFRLDRGETRKLTLELEQGQMVRIIVTDGDSDDAPGVRAADVVLTEGGVSSFPWLGRTNEGGQVVLGPILETRATAMAMKEGYVSRTAVPVPQEITGPLKIALQKGATLSGRVVDERGFPIDGASVEVRGTDSYGMPILDTPLSHSAQQQYFEWSLGGPKRLIPMGELGVLPGPLPPIPDQWFVEGGIVTREADVWGDLFREQLFAWITNDRGRFTATPVTPGRVRAFVHHPDYLSSTSDTVELKPGGSAEVTVVLHGGAMLEGKVVDWLDRPLGQVRVRLFAQTGGFDQSTYSAEDGSFAFAAVPGQVVATLARPETPFLPVLRKALTVSDERREIVLKLPERREALTVRVADAHGIAVNSAQVTLLSLQPEVPLRRTLFTGLDGEATFNDVVGLRVRVSVQAAGYASRSLDSSAAPAELLVELAEGVLVEGRITAVRGRRAVEGATVTLVAGGERKTTKTDDVGTYHFEQVPEGPVLLLVEHPEFAEAEATATVNDTGRSDRPFELPDIDLAEAKSASGTVVDQQGAPVAGARVGVGLVPRFVPASGEPKGTSVTDSAGRFTLTGLAGQVLTLEAYAVHAGEGTVEVDLSRGSVDDARIVLSGPEELAEPSSGGSLAVTLGERGQAPNIRVVIAQVATGSEAEKAGLLAGDELELIDGTPPADMHDARRRLSGPMGNTVVVTVNRDGDSQSYRVTLQAVQN